jgi:hypothetical protein
LMVSERRHRLSRQNPSAILLLPDRP